MVTAYTSLLIHAYSRVQVVFVDLPGSDVNCGRSEHGTIIIRSGLSNGLLRTSLGPDHNSIVISQRCSRVSNPVKIKGTGKRQQHVVRTCSVCDLGFMSMLVADRYRFNEHVLIDTAPMPDHIPKVKELGTTSAPLLSAAYFIGARCRPYNDDYMQCKTEAYGRGELDCMREGRKVTRCAASV